MPENAEPTTPKPVKSIEPVATRPRRKRGFFAKLRLLFLWNVLLFCIAIQSPVFPLVVRAVVHFEAWRKGSEIHIGTIEGSIFDPIVLRDTVFTYHSETGATTRLEVRRVRASFAWSNVFPEPVSIWVRNAANAVGLATIGRNNVWWQRLELDGVTAKLALPTAQSNEPAAARRWLRSQFGEGWLHAPLYLTVRDAEFVIERGGDFLHAAGVRFSLSEIEPGYARTSQLNWKFGDLSKHFRDLHAYSSLEKSRASIAGCILTPDVRIENFSVNLSDLAKGRLTLATQLAAFGGTINAEAETAPRGRELHFDADGTFENINVGGLATFLGLSEAAGGLVKSGNFIYRGTPRDPAHAEARLNLEAGNFQWETRQWDSLTLRLSLLDQRLQIPELKLRQGVNQLSLNGSMALPNPRTSWWQRQFDFKVDADIHNLTDLSALLLPDFKFAAGQLFIRGSVSGSGADAPAIPTFDGQLIFSGSSLKWRTAPLDVLNAAIVLRGHELQIINAQLLHGDDFLRGVGRISLSGDGGYEGIIRTSVRDLAIYQPLLAPPVLPVPLAGRAVIDWRGNGLGKKHEGTFTAKLEKFRTLGSAGLQATHPLDANFSGSYAGEQMQFEKFELSEDGTTLSAAVAIGPSAVNLRNIRVQHKGQPWLQGDALLPLDLWQRWPDVDFSHLLNDDTVARVNLTATNLGLRETSLLTGIEWPLAGTLNGTLTADGPLKSLKLGGALTLAKGTLPLNWRGTTITDINSTFTLEDSTITLTKASGRHPTGAFTAEGKLDLTNARKPLLETTGAGTHEGQPFSFKLTGPAEKPTLTTEGPAPFAPAR